MLANLALSTVRRNLPSSGARSQPQAACAQHVADQDQRLGEQGQRLLAVREHSHDLRNHVGDQPGDDGEGDHDHDKRVQQCLQDLLPGRLRGFEVIGQAGEQRVQFAGFLACVHQGPIDRRKDAFEAAERGMQRVAGQHLGANAGQHFLNAGILVLLDERGQ